MMYIALFISVLLGCSSNEQSMSVSPQDIGVSSEPQKDKSKQVPKGKREGSFIFDPINHMMMAQMKDGQYTAVVNGYHSHLQRNPEDGFARVMLTWAHHQLGNAEHVQKEWNRLSLLRKGSYEFWQSLKDADRSKLLETFLADACIQNKMHPCPSRPEQPSELYPVFEQWAWMSHREDRLNRWLKEETSWDALTVANDIGLQAGMQIADVGGGEGWFSIPFASVVGRSGRVYDVEIDPSYTQFVDFVSEKFDLSQLQGLQATYDDPSLPKGELDIVFVCEVMKAVVTDQQILDNPEYYHTVALPFVQRLVAGLNATGRLVFIEHDMPEGVLSGTSETLLRRLIVDAGLQVVERGTQYGPLQLLLIAERVE